MFFSIPWIYVIDISGFYFEEYMLGYLLCPADHLHAICNLRELIENKIPNINELHTDYTEFCMQRWASFKSTLHFLEHSPFAGVFFQKTVKYFWGHRKDADISNSNEGHLIIFNHSEKHCMFELTQPQLPSLKPLTGSP